MIYTTYQNGDHWGMFICFLFVLPTLVGIKGVSLEINTKTNQLELASVTFSTSSWDDPLSRCRGAG
jgi:hypothetical protein